MAACKRILKRRGEGGEAEENCEDASSNSLSPTSTRLGIGLQANNIKMDGPREIWAQIVNSHLSESAQTAECQNY